MSSTVTILNNTNLYLEPGVSVWITYFTHHRLEPGETWTFKPGKVWHSIYAKLWDPRNQISIGGAGGVIANVSGINGILTGLAKLLPQAQKFVAELMQQSDSINTKYGIQDQDNRNNLVQWVTSDLFEAGSKSQLEACPPEGYLYRVGSNYFVSEYPETAQSILKLWINDQAIYERGWYFGRDKNLVIEGGPNEIVKVLHMNGESFRRCNALSLDNKFPSLRLFELKDECGSYRSCTG